MLSRRLPFSKQVFILCLILGEKLWYYSTSIQKKQNKQNKNLKINLHTDKFLSFKIADWKIKGGMKFFWLDFVSDKSTEKLNYMSTMLLLVLEREYGLTSCETWGQNANYKGDIFSPALRVTCCFIFLTFSFYFTYLLLVFMIHGALNRKEYFRKYTIFRFQQSQTNYLLSYIFKFPTEILWLTSGPNDFHKFDREVNWIGFESNAIEDRAACWCGLKDLCVEGGWIFLYVSAVGIKLRT